MYRALNLLLILFLLSFNVTAASNDDFDKGVKHFKQQEYKQATKFFTQAYQKGLKTAALFHNLGVSYLKLGDYRQAEKYFKLAAGFPAHKMMAYYNLGLVAKKQGQTKLARQYFSQVKNQAKQKKLRTLARIQLGEVRTIDPEQNWSLYGEISFGHDDNITIVSDAAATKKGSAYTYYYIEPAVRLMGGAKDNLNLYISSFKYDYSDFTQYNYAKTTLGLEADFTTGSWDNIIKLASQNSTYGGRDYLGSTRFEVSTYYNINSDNRLRLRFQYDDITGETGFLYLTGSRQRLRAQIRHYSTNSNTRLYYEYETNDRANDAANNLNYSPTRHKMNASYTYDLSDTLELGAGINYRISTYPSIGTTAEREDKRQRINLRLTYKFNPELELRGEIEQTDNNSSDANYTYQQQINYLSLIASF